MAKERGDPISVSLPKPSTHRQTRANIDRDTIGSGVDLKPERRELRCAHFTLLGRVQSVSKSKREGEPQPYIKRQAGANGGIPEGWLRNGWSWAPGPATGPGRPEVRNWQAIGRLDQKTKDRQGKTGTGRPGLGLGLDEGLTVWLRVSVSSKIGKYHPRSQDSMGICAM
jgi:hypothetical protein